MVLADRVLDDARERHADYWELLNSRSQMARPASVVSTRQYATTDAKSPDVPKGPAS